MCRLRSTWSVPASTAWSDVACDAGGPPAGWSRTAAAQRSAAASVATPMMTRAPRQDTPAASAARGALPTSAPSTPTVAVSADIMPNCERGNQFAAIFSAPVKVTVAPRPTSSRPAKRIVGVEASPMARDAEAHDRAATRDHPARAHAVDQHPARNHEARVRVEVHRGEQADHRAGDAERLHQLLGDHAGRRAVQERDEEDEGGDAPHEPSAGPRGGGIGRGHAPRVQKPAGSHSRTMASSASVGVGVGPTSGAVRSVNPVAARTLSTLCPGW